MAKNAQHRHSKVGAFDIINVTILSLLAFVCVYPFYYLIIYSLSNSTEATRHGIWLLPVGFTVKNYKTLFQRGDIWMATFISASRAVIGTIVHVACSSFFAYLLTKKDLIGRKIFYRLLVITMYLNAGIIPYFMVMKAYGLKDNYLLYILPGAVGAYNVILIKTYMENIPAELEEAARIDGAGYFKAFVKVIFPVCTPVLATVTIFSAVSQWNSWQDNFYLVRDPKLKTLQLLLMEYLQNMDSTLITDINTALDRMNRTSTLSLKTCISVITMIPIMLVYPLFQKYFVKGIMLGSVKG